MFKRTNKLGTHNIAYIICILLCILCTKEDGTNGRWWRVSKNKTRGKNNSNENYIFFRDSQKGGERRVKWNNIKWVLSARIIYYINIIAEQSQLQQVGILYYVYAVLNRKRTRDSTVIGNGGKSLQFVGGGTKEW